METPEQRIQRVVREEVAIAPYDPAWPESFGKEREHLRSCLPGDLIGRIEHFGSTAVPGLAAKPIVDMLVEVTDLEATRARIAPVLEAQGYEYFWRPSFGDDVPPFYAWFIKRDPRTGARTHHIHMVEADFTEHWDRLLFRDHLIAHPALAREYEALKGTLASSSSRDRVAYTRGKTEFIVRVTGEAKRAHARNTTRMILVRHAESAPRSDLPEAEWPLSQVGHAQAKALADVLADAGIMTVVSSPYVRAIETVRPLASRAGCPVEIHRDLRERRLCEGLRDDWLDLVEKAWSDFSFALPGGESGLDCQRRMRVCLTDLARRFGGETIAVCSHGNAIGLFLNSIEPGFGFVDWERMRTPDVFEIDWLAGQPRWHRGRSGPGREGDT